MNRSLAMPLVILSILAGILHGYSQYRSSKRESLGTKQPLQSGEGEKENQEAHPQPSTSPSDGKTKPETGEIKRDEVLSLKKMGHLFNLAGAAFETMQYLEAEDLLQKGIQDILKLKKIGKGLSPEIKKLYSMMDRLWKRSIVYYSLIRDMEPRKKKDLSPLFLVDFHQGGKSIALGYKKIQGQAIFTLLFSPFKKGFAKRLQEGEKIFIPQKEVKKATPLTYEEYKKIGEAWAEREAQRLSPDDFMSFYRLVYLCVRNRIFRPVSLLLTQVLRGKNGILLLEAFGNHPRYTIQELKNFWLYGEKQGGIQIALVKPLYTPTSPNPPPQKRGSQITGTGSSPQKPTRNSASSESSTEPTQQAGSVKKRKVSHLSKELQEIMDKARKTFQEGMKYYKQIYIHKNSQKRQAYIHKALEKFRKAYALYDQVAQKEPDLAGLEETMNRLSTLIYDCQKLLNF